MDDDSVQRRAANDYKLYIFLSVDVIGSTSFKYSNYLQVEGDGRSEKPKGWLSIIKKFYENFDNVFRQNTSSCCPDWARPELWKALGDELIYRAEITDCNSAALLVKAFIATLHKTRTTVRALSQSLDLKGSAWVADFPARNAIIDIEALQAPFRDSGHHPPGDPVPDRKVYDHIGPSMDAGFRLGKAATRRKLPLSVELALILSVATANERGYPFIFGYDGREDLKGVLGGEEYPIIWIDIEDGFEQRTVNRREAAMLQRQPEISPEAVMDFCESYIHASRWMENPYLKGDNEKLFKTVPQSHIEHAENILKEEKIENSGETQEFDGKHSGAEIQVDELLSDMPLPRNHHDDHEIYLTLSILDLV